MSNLLSFPAPSFPTPHTMILKKKSTETPRTRRTANLLKRGHTWYLRRMIDGQPETLSLHTTDLGEAITRRDAHIRAHAGKSVAEIREARATPDRSPLIEDARDAFLSSRTAKGARAATLRSYTDILSIFVAAYPRTAWQRLAPADYLAWLTARYTNPTSAESIARHITAFLRWATETGHLVNPILARDARFRAPLAETTIEFLSVADAQRLLTAATTLDLPVIALGLFAGIRPHEVGRMTWSMIDFAARRIALPAHVTKTRTPRTLEGLPDTLWRHIDRYRAVTGPVTRDQSAAILRTRAAAGEMHWPHDALRHTFATYHVAAYQNPGLTTILLGHANQRMLTAHYNGATASIAEANAFFAIGKPAETLVAPAPAPTESDDPFAFSA